MLLSDDMLELISLFRAHEVDFVIIGGVAVNAYGYSRVTQDLDILLLPGESNAARIMAALNAFGFGDAGIHASHFEYPGNAIHLGIEPNRIDLLTHVYKVSSQRIFENLVEREVGGISLPMIHFDDLIDVKKKSPRLRDHADAEELLKRRSR